MLSALPKPKPYDLPPLFLVIVWAALVTSSQVLGILTLPSGFVSPTDLKAPWWM